jgi:hypothetical protein
LHFLAAHAPTGKRILTVNLDETAIVYREKQGKGNVFLRKKPLWKACAAVQGKAQSKACRIYLTHVALVCDDPAIQPLLPQVLLVNAATLPLSLVDEIASFLPPNVQIWRRKSAWVNHNVMCALISLLAESLSHLASTHQTILMMDAYPAHKHTTVFHSARAMSIWLLILPARLTWLMQVLDTHGFYRCKQFLRGLIAHELVQSPDGLISLQTWLRCICRTIRGVLQARNWGTAFAQNGFPYDHTTIRINILVRVGSPDTPIHIPAVRPTAVQIKAVFPKRSKIQMDVLFPHVRPLTRLRVKTASAA